MPEGPIELTILNAAKTDSFHCDVVLEGMAGIIQDVVENSMVWTRINVAPGQYKVTLSAKVAGRMRGHLLVLEIKPGETFKASMSLPIA